MEGDSKLHHDFLCNMQLPDAHYSLLLQQIRGGSLGNPLPETSFSSAGEAPCLRSSLNMNELLPSETFCTSQSIQHGLSAPHNEWNVEMDQASSPLQPNFPCYQELDGTASLYPCNLANGTMEMDSSRWDGRFEEYPDLGQYEPFSNAAMECPAAFQPKASQPPVSPSETQTYPRDSLLPTSTTQSYLPKGPTATFEAYPLPPLSPAESIESRAPTSSNMQAFHSPKNLTRFAPTGNPGSEYDTDAESATSEEPYAQLIFKALMSAPGHKMALKEIYDWFRKYTNKWKNSDTKGWQNSIRHNLSMNAVSTFLYLVSFIFLFFFSFRLRGDT
jgi:hypothetical protein